MRLPPPPSGTRLETDVCIIGAGAAGITIAGALGKAGIDTILLEAGAEIPTEEGQEPYRGRSISATGRIQDAYLHTSRLRCVGGTTQHWAGWCRPLAPLDLQARSWVPDSGWPLTWQELEPWYRPAAELLGVGDFEERPLQPHGLPKDASFEPILYRSSTKQNFGRIFGPELETYPKLRFFDHSAVLAIRTEGQRVRYLELSSPTGNWTVGARRFVLACGGIENARLLLISDQDRPGGLGNDSDLVGRYFSDHPEIKPCAKLLLFPEVWTKPPWSNWKQSRNAGFHGLLRLSDAFQQRRELLGFVAELRPAPPEEKQDLAAVLTGMEGLSGLPTNAWLGELVGRVEVAPDRESRVKLGDQRDALGQRRLLLDWRFGKREVNTVWRATQELARLLGALGIGRVQPVPEATWQTMIPGAHHLGTTRMGASPQSGVVDAHCRLHSAPNLWVAGSSVFSTTGVSNPTLTILALALRIADELIRGEE